MCGVTDTITVARGRRFIACQWHQVKNDLPAADYPLVWTQAENVGEWPDL